MPLLRWPRDFLKAAVAALVLIAASFGLAALISSVASLGVSANEYRVGAWETRHFTGKWLDLLGAKVRSQPSTEQENATLREVFSLTRDIDTLEAALSDTDARGQGRDAAKVADIESNERTWKAAVICPCLDSDAGLDLHFGDARFQFDLQNSGIGIQVANFRQLESGVPVRGLQ